MSSDPRTTTHELKVWTRPFAQLWLGNKTCELRRNDRGFRVGDDLELSEWDEEARAYTGRTISARVTHMLEATDAAQWGAPLAEGWCILSLHMAHLDAE